MINKFPNRLTCSGKNSHFVKGDTFSEYLETTREMIANTRVDLTPATADKIIACNSPYEWLPQDNPRNCGVVLLHGLLDSPFVTRDLGQFLVAQGFVTRSVLLPGHGTRPGDLLEVSATEWLNASAYAILDLKKKVEKVIVIGFSTGGALAIYHALQGLPIDSLLLIAPALRIKHPLAFISPWLKMIDWVHPRLPWFYVGDDCDYAKYESLCLNAIAQVYGLTQSIKTLSKTKQISQPIMMILSNEDEVIDSANALAFCQSQPNPENYAILYSREKIATSNQKIKVIPSHNFSERILDYSHSCIPIAPANPHYGKHGDYKDFSHYRYNRKEISAELRSHGLYHGAAHSKNIKMFWLQRISYNPHFNELTADIALFLQRINLL